LEDSVGLIKVIIVQSRKKRIQEIL
jgi:hypothetical protein